MNMEDLQAASILPAFLFLLRTKKQIVSPLPQLFMIEPIRSGILSVEGACDNVEEEILSMERENVVSSSVFCIYSARQLKEALKEKYGIEIYTVGDLVRVAELYWQWHNEARCKLKYTVF